MPDAAAMDITDQLIVEKDGPIGRIRFDNQAKRNAMTFEMWRDLGTVLEDFAADDAIRVIILSGEGGKAFCAGADISQFEKNRSSEDGVKLYNAAVEKSGKLLRDIEKPTIAKIQGPCVGGGVGIAVGCDLRIAQEGSIFAIPAAKLGLGYRIEGLKPFVDLVGPATAKEVFFTAKRFSAEEAMAMGMVDRVMPRSVFDAFVEDYAQSIAANAPLTIRAVKICVAESLKNDPDLALAQQVVDECFASEDYIEGRTAFMEKRTPQFKGR